MAVPLIRIPDARTPFLNPDGTVNWTWFKFLSNVSGQEVTTDVALPEGELVQGAGNHKIKPFASTEDGDLPIGASDGTFEAHRPAAGVGIALGFTPHGLEISTTGGVPSSAAGLAFVLGDDGEPGPIGPPGVAGVAGSAGSAGAIGPRGAPGEDGENGLAGPPGSVGPQGPTGPTGPAGTAGVSGIIRMVDTDDPELPMMIPGAAGVNALGAKTLLYSATTVPAGNTISNTTAETAFSSSFTLPSNSVSVGDVIRITLAGVYSTALVAPSLRGKLKFGSTVLLDTGALTTIAGVSSVGWSAYAWLTVTAVGASGTIEAQGYASFATAATTTLSAQLSNTAAISLDFTTGQAITVTITWGTASTSNTIQLREMVIEQISATSAQGASGRLLNVQTITATGSGTYTPTAGTNSIMIQLQGGGGGGGGATTGLAGNCAIAQAGGAGGFLQKIVTSGFSGSGYVVGAKGAGGASGNNSGGAGTATTFTVGAITYSAGGGGAGAAGGANGGTPPFHRSPSLGGTCTNGDLNISGGVGTAGVALSTTDCFTCRGGDAVLGAGGSVTAPVLGANTSVAGLNAPAGFGGGGGGAIVLGTGASVAGGDGSNGVIVIYEYS